MEVFCSRVYTGSHFGTQRITLTGYPLKCLSWGARRICPETMFLGQLPTHSSTFPPFQEGNFYRAFLQKEWNVEFIVAFGPDLEILVPAVLGKGKGVSLWARMALSKGNKAFPCSHPHLAMSKVRFPRLWGMLMKAHPPPWRASWF